MTSTCFRGEDGQGRGTAEEAGPGGTTRVPARASAGLSAQLCKWWAQSALSSLGAGREKASIGGRRGEETASRLQEMLRPHCPCLRRQDSMQVEAGLNMITSVSGPLAIGETRPGVTMHRVFGETRQGVSQSEYCIFWRKRQPDGPRSTGRRGWRCGQYAVSLRNVCTVKQGSRQNDLEK